MPGSVLIRALEPVEGIELMKKFRNKEDLVSLTSGPGKLCQAMDIDRILNRIDVTDTKSPLFGVENPHFEVGKIRVVKRIGVMEAKE